MESIHGETLWAQSLRAEVSTSSLLGIFLLSSVQNQTELILSEHLLLAHDFKDM